jgi:hypothetical protein
MALVYDSFMKAKQAKCTEMTSALLLQSTAKQQHPSKKSQTLLTIY